MTSLQELFEVKKLKPNVKLSFILRAFTLLWETSPVLTVSMFVLKAVSALYPIATLYVSKLAIDSVVSVIGSKGNGSELSRLYMLIFFLVGMWILHSLSNRLQLTIASLLHFRVEQTAQISIMRKCSEFDIAFFENPRNLNMLENAAVGSSGNIYTVIALLFNFVETSITLISFIFIFFKLHWIVVVIVVLTTLPQILSNNYFAKKRWEISTSLAEPRRMRYYYSNLVRMRGPAKEIKLFGLFDNFLDRFVSFARQFIYIEGRFVRKQATVNFLISLISIAGAAFVWLYIIQKAVAGAIGVGDVVLFTGAVTNSQGSLTALFNLAGQILQNVLFIGNYFLLLDIDPSSIEGALKGPAGNGHLRCGSMEAPLKIHKGIEFRNVSFKYPGSGRYVLSNVSFKLHPKETVAIVGQNGAGKTTLIKLLVRLYDPTEGSILLDGRDIKEYDLESLHRIFGVIFQDYVCYPLTVKENIGFGKIESANDKPLIIEVSKKAGAHEFISKLPDKYESYLGRTFQGSGVDLSTGQWQRISMARALMREDAPVLILDEPTAALDAFSEYEVYRKFSDMTADRLSVIISHRFSTVRSANHVLVLEDGCLVEEGSHAELLKQETLYREMYNLQADRYR